MCLCCGRGWGICLFLAVQKAWLHPLSSNDSTIFLVAGLPVYTKFSQLGFRWEILTCWPSVVPSRCSPRERSRPLDCMWQTLLLFATLTSYLFAIHQQRKQNRLFCHMVTAACVRLACKGLVWDTVFLALFAYLVFFFYCLMISFLRFSLLTSAGSKEGS